MPSPGRQLVWMIAWYGLRARDARPPASGSTCPAWHLALRHHPGCPYDGLQMRQPWARYRQDQTRTRPGT